MSGVKRHFLISGMFASFYPMAVGVWLSQHPETPIRLQIAYLAPSALYGAWLMLTVWPYLEPRMRRKRLNVLPYRVMAGSMAVGLVAAYTAMCTMTHLTRRWLAKDCLELAVACMVITVLAWFWALIDQTTIWFRQRRERRAGA